MQAIIFIGIQATGKSTFYVRNFLNSHVRISMDLLNTRNKENSWLETCFKSHQRFVVDNTNPTKEERAKYINSDKNELLFQRGINFNELPKWQKRGVGLFWEEYEKAGWNPKLQREEKSLKQRIKVDLELPMKDEYNFFIKNILENK
ncbi:MAG: tRNA(His) 5'-end guanylyltransferase [Arenicella sp.]|jgi:tRNA(His) 5'-end guanylyltransferase